MGASTPRILVRHILPNAISPVVVLVTMGMGSMVGAEILLSWLGLGIQPPAPSWGGMLYQGRQFMEIAPWVAVYPGLAIMIAVLSFNFFGDGLRDGLDPKLKN